MTKFEGMVNGVSFDTVEEYNEAVQKAIESGVGFTASTRTYTVEDSERKNEQVSTEWRPVDLPEYDLDNIDDKFTDEDLDVVIASFHSDVADLMKENILRKVQKEHPSTDTLRQLVDKIAKFEHQLKCTEKAAAAKITIMRENNDLSESLLKRIEKLHSDNNGIKKQLDILNKSSQVLKKEIGFYNGVLDSINRECINHECPTSSKDEDNEPVCKERCSGKDEDNEPVCKERCSGNDEDNETALSNPVSEKTEDTEDRLANALAKLISELF